MWVSIWNDLLGKSEPPIHVVHMHLSNSFSGDCCHAKEEGGGSDAFVIDNGEYSIFFIAFWKLGDEIYGYDFEGLCAWGGWDAIKWNFSLVCEVFVLLADCVSFDVFGYSLLYFCPPIGSIYCLEGGVSLGVLLLDNHDIT